jgi:hypothetical protein
MAFNNWAVYTMGMASTTAAVTMEEPETALAQPAPARIDVRSLTASMPMGGVCEMATAHNGSTAVRGLLEGMVL